jgi:hypothetical protein
MQREHLVGRDVEVSGEVVLGDFAYPMFSIV